MRFVEGGIAPAARTVGAGVCVPSSADLFFADLPLDIRDRLVTFLSQSGKTLPLQRDTIGLWHEFVVAAFPSRTRVEGESLRGWLISQGWPVPAANELVFRFYDQCQLLTRYAEELAIV